MTNLSPQAQAIIDAAYALPLRNGQPNIVAALRALVSNNEEWVDGTYMVKSEDILNIATELENL